MKVRFKKEINPYTVTDTAVFRNGNRKLRLSVRSDAPKMMISLKKAQEVLSAAKPDGYMEAARYFASSIFGEEQAQELMEFYGEPGAVISACGMYFDRRLKDLITKAQKK